MNPKRYATIFKPNSAENPILLSIDYGESEPPFGVTEKYVPLSDYDDLKKQLEDAVKFLKITISFAPKGEIEKGLPPMFYHTLSYEGELELDSKINKAREFLKKYEVSK